MPSSQLDIRYVCLSDLHLGEINSILTPVSGDSCAVDPFSAGPVLEQLCRCFRQVIGMNRGESPTTLILNGDFLDLAFGGFSRAVMIFERVAELLMSPGAALFDKIVYLPGNHDHHMWEMARETQYVTSVLKTHHREGMPEPAHVTSPFLDDAVPSYLLNQVLHHVAVECVTQDGLGDGAGAHAQAAGGAETRVHIMYPNLFLTDASGERTVVIHHGHYVESLYRLFSRARRWLFPDREEASSVEVLEGENFAWIDFVWSLLGRSGGAGEDVETLFELLRYPAHAKAFTDSLAARIAESRDLPLIPGDWLETVVLRRVFAVLSGKLAGERGQRDVVLSRDASAGLDSYLFGPTSRQLREHLGRVPEDLTFIFGHTHKPFEALRPRPERGRKVAIYNSGGWTIDTREANSAIGASLLFMNAELEVAALRLYNDTGAEDPFSLRVRGLSDGTPARPGAFCREIQRRVGTDGSSEWRELGARASSAIAVRRKRHEQRYRG